MALGLPEELLPVFIPVAVYWIASGVHLLIGSKDDSRLFTKEEEDTENLVTKRQVLVCVLLNQALQMALAAATFVARNRDRGPAPNAPPPSWPQLAKQLAVAMAIMETGAYFWHRWTHQNEFLMKHVHSMHHRVVAPYAFAAQYVHPVDFFCGDLLPCILGSLLSGMSPRTGAAYFTVVTLKVVDDHCGHWFLNCIPVNRVFTYKTAFHMVHHRRGGFKHNYSIYFFCIWDVLLGTYLPYTVEKRKEGGYKIRTAKDDS